MKISSHLSSAAPLGHRRSLYRTEAAASCWQPITSCHCTSASSCRYFSQGEGSWYHGVCGWGCAECTTCLAAGGLSIRKQSKSPISLLNRSAPTLGSLLHCWWWIRSERELFPLTSLSDRQVKSALDRSHNYADPQKEFIYVQNSS